MSSNENEDPRVIAQRAERDLNSHEAKTGSSTSKGASDSVLDSGVDESVTAKFPGATVSTGGQGSGGSRLIPDEEGGGINPETGHQTRADDFEGEGGPEEKAKLGEVVRGGDQDVRGNVRN